MSEAKAFPRVSTRHRTMVIWCPDWPVIAAMSAAKITPKIPAAVFDKGKVFACSPAARADGVRRGMRRRDAQSRCPGLSMHDYNPVLDGRAFETVLTEIEALSPGVALLRPGLCALKVPSRFYGGEEQAAAVISERLVSLGLWDQRTGIADGLFAAEHAARRALPQDNVIVAPGGSAYFLQDLSIDVLDDADLTSLLRRMGLHTLGDFAMLSAADVTTRFGTYGAFAHRLAKGEDAQLLSGRRPPPELECSATFEPPLESIETIAFSLRQVAEEFVTQLAHHDLVCTELRIEVDCEGMLAGMRNWRHPRWFCSTDVIDRVRWQLQASDVVTAPVSDIRLVPQTVEELGVHAEGLWGGGHDERIDRGLARVQSMVGHDSVLSASIQGGRMPAQRQALVPWGERKQGLRPTELPWPGSLPPPSPATVFHKPVEAMVCGAGGATVGVNGRGMVTAEPLRFRADGSSEFQPIASWAGPWPIEELWWDATAARRIARFQVVGVDGSAWLMIVENGQWWTEARYD